MPASLAPSARRSFGHLSRNDAAGATAASASRSATPATKPSVAATRRLPRPFQEEARGEIARRRRPAPAAPAASGGLVSRHDPESARLPCPAERHRLGVRRADAVAALRSGSPPLRRPGRDETASAQNSERAAAAAAPTSGAGTIQNRRITALARPSTILSAGAIGSKAPRGSSKYMILTMRT